MVLSIILFIVELVEAIKSKVVRLGGRLYGCSDCDYTTSYSSTIGNHIEAKHLSTQGFICTFCQKFCPTRNALKSHVTKQHKAPLF
jgi:hypothetical protein